MTGAETMTATNPLRRARQAGCLLLALVLVFFAPRPATTDPADTDAAKPDAAASATADETSTPTPLDELMSAADAIDGPLRSLNSLGDDLRGLGSLGRALGALGALGSGAEQTDDAADVPAKAE